MNGRRSVNLRRSEEESSERFSLTTRKFGGMKQSYPSPYKIPDPPVVNTFNTFIQKEREPEVQQRFSCM